MTAIRPPRAYQFVLFLLALLTFRGADAYAQAAASWQADLDAAEQVVIPQSRSFALHPNNNRGIEIVSVHAEVAVIERTATTTLDIALRNASSSPTEAVLVLPVPDGAVVSSFMFDGVSSEPTATVLPRDKAREMYDAIVRRARDPALLEFAGYNLLRSSVFPIAGFAEQRVRLTYEHILEGDGNRVDYVLPRSESLQVVHPWSIDLTIEAKQPVSTIYSPSHELLTNRIDGNRVRVKLSGAGKVQPGSFMLSYLMERDDVSASLFAYPDPTIGGGYFLLMAGLPAAPAVANAVRREVTIVIDRSGSMAGEKMDQAKAAAAQVIEALNEGESFNIIDYSNKPSMFARQPVTKSRQAVLEAQNYVRTLQPVGGTNIHDALLEALRQAPAPGTLPIVLFLTDGLPTVGRTRETVIRQMIEAGNAHNRRVFTFGVGHDVNVPLLDRLADATRAASTYVLPEEDVELKVARVFKKLSGPVLAAPVLSNAGNLNRIHDDLPAALPDLFEDDQLVVLGKYRDGDDEGGALELNLRGSYLGTPRTFSFSFDLSKATTRNAFVPRLWASRRIALLVDEVRQAGALSAEQPSVVGQSIFSDPRFSEIADEILRLSTEFGILTEYTSFLATEGTNLANWNELRVGCGTTLDERAVRTRSGTAAVNQALNYNASKVQDVLNRDNRYWDANLNQVQITTVQQVCDRAFFNRAGCWIDSRLVNEHNQQIVADEEVAFGSEAHRRILDALIAQGRQAALSLPGDILIRYEGKNVLVKSAQPAPTNPRHDN